MREVRRRLNRLEERLGYTHPVQHTALEVFLGIDEADCLCVTCRAAEDPGDFDASEHETARHELAALLGVDPSELPGPIEEVNRDA